MELWSLGELGSSNVHRVSGQAKGCHLMGEKS